MLYSKAKNTVEILSYSHIHISAKVNESSSSHHWTVTSFYGEPNTSRLHTSWELLVTLKPTAIELWLVIGDFNEIIFQKEKSGGPQRSEKLMHNFRTTLVQCGLKDLGHFRNFFTWSNKHKTNTFTKERLDRVVANQV